MDWQTTFPLAVSIVLAIFGYVAKYVNDIKIQRRKDQLDRVNQQLRDFYGPLFALNRISSILWRYFREQYRAEGSFWHGDAQPTDEEADAWRLWMQEVFIPLNEALERAILQHADLLDEDEMPDCLLAVCANIAGYKPLLKQWANGDYSMNTSLVNYPTREMEEYTGRAFADLKAKQAQLLGLAHRSLLG